MPKKTKKVKKDTKAEWRLKYPMKAAYQTLKYNSKRRNIEFDLTFEEFEEFAIKEDYIGKKGRLGTSYTIDRKEEHIGYTKNNIQILTRSQNSLKRWKKLFGYFDERENKMVYYTAVMTERPSDDFPDIEISKKEMNSKLLINRISIYQ